MIVHFAVFAAALPPIRLCKISKYLSYNQISHAIYDKTASDRRYNITPTGYLWSLSCKRIQTDFWRLEYFIEGKIVRKTNNHIAFAQYKKNHLLCILYESNRSLNVAFYRR